MINDKEEKMEEFRELEGDVTQVFKGFNFRFFIFFEMFIIIPVVLFAFKIILDGMLDVQNTLFVLSYTTIVLLIMRLRKVIVGQKFVFFKHFFEHTINGRTTRVDYSDINSLTKFPGRGSRPIILSVNFGSSGHLTMSRIEKLNVLYEALIGKIDKVKNVPSVGQRKKKIVIGIVVSAVTTVLTLLVSYSSLVVNSYFLSVVALIVIGVLYYVINRLYGLGTETIPYVIGLLPVVFYNPYNQFVFNKCKQHFSEQCYEAVERSFVGSSLNDRWASDDVGMLREEKDILSVLKAGCKTGHRKSCYYVAVAYSNSGDVMPALKYANQACELKLIQACHLVDKLLVDHGSK